MLYEKKDDKEARASLTNSFVVINRRAVSSGHNLSELITGGGVEPNDDEEQNGHSISRIQLDEYGDSTQDINGLLSLATRLGTGGDNDFTHALYIDAKHLADATTAKSAFVRQLELQSDPEAFCSLMSEIAKIHGFPQPEQAVAVISSAFNRAKSLAGNLKRFAASIKDDQASQHSLRIEVSAQLMSTQLKSYLKRSKGSIASLITPPADTTERNSIIIESFRDAAKEIFDCLSKGNAIGGKKANKDQSLFSLQATMIANALGSVLSVPKVRKAKLPGGLHLAPESRVAFSVDALLNPGILSDLSKKVKANVKSVGKHVKVVPLEGDYNQYFSPEMKDCLSAPRLFSGVIGLAKLLNKGANVALTLAPGTL